MNELKVGDSAEPEPPEAPIWLDHNEANAWQQGWRSGHAARATPPVAPAAQRDEPAAVAALRASLDALIEERRIRVLGQSPECGKTHWESIRDLRRTAYAATDAAIETARRVLEGEALPVLEALTDEALMLDIDGDDPLSDELGAVWEEAMEASRTCMHPRLSGFSEWCGRTQAACRVLIAKLPAIAARAALATSPRGNEGKGLGYETESSSARPEAVDGDRA